MNRERRRVPRLALAAVGLAAGFLTALQPATSLHGQARCVDGGVVSPAEPVVWPSPLDRRVDLEASALPLGAALDRLAGASGVRLSYSTDAIDVDQTVCASFASVQLGDALSDLVRAAAGPAGAAAVHPVAAGPDHVVLAPVAIAEARPAAAPQRERVIPLESIVVTGSASALDARGLPFAADVIDPRDIDGARTLGDLLKSAVPGFWAWTASPTDLEARYVSIRGASSFGEPRPKLYLDGIQVADPQAFARIAPEAVERVEVVRGPHGAALYGADAIDGVINVVTRRGVPEPGAPRLQLRSGAGLVSADHAPGSVLRQDHVLAGWLGSGGRTATFSLAGGSSGEILPGAGSRYLSLIGGGRAAGTSTILSGTARVDFASARPGTLPWPDRSAPSAGATFGAFSEVAGPSARSVLQYTFGTTLEFVGAERQSHTLVAGVDGFRRTGDVLLRQLITGGQAARLRDGRTAGDRLSLRAKSVFDVIATPRVAASLSVIGEHTRIREVEALPPAGVMSTNTGAVGERDGASPAGLVHGGEVTEFATTGFAFRANGSYRRRLFVDAGLRLETNGGPGTPSTVHALPTVGTSLVLESDRVTTTLRTAYGKGIRSARSALRDAVAPGVRLPSSAYLLPPETQTGIEAGIELEFDGRARFELTRFDQLASGLFQAVVAPASMHTGSGAAPLLLRNVGAISNVGWEAGASGVFGGLALNGTFASVDSRVRRLAEGYEGDLRVGDRMLEVPASTASLSVSWTAPLGTASLTASRAWNWIGYDHDRLAATPRDPAASSYVGAGGNRMRDAWRRYDGALNLNAGASIAVRPDLDLLVGVENLLDNQRGEPDTLTIVPGRAYTLGLRATF